MIADGGVFTCHGSKLPNAEAISALRASLLILENRYNLDCLMQRYQGEATPPPFPPGKAPATVLEKTEALKTH